MNEPIFTRYLYFKVEVVNSLQWSILDKQVEESLYWAYEMYFSGFQNEIFDFLLAFCLKYNSEIYPHYYIYILNLYKEWVVKRDDSKIGTIIMLLVNSKVSLTNSLRVIQNVQIKDLNIHIPNFTTQQFSEKELHKYKTLKLTNRMRNWNFLDRVACKYCVRRVMCQELSILYPTIELINFDKWMYHASKTPIWKNRIIKFNGNIEHGTLDVSIDNEEFFEQYDYEPDEQSKNFKEMLWGNSKEKYENLSIADFCVKYGKDSIYICHKIIISKKL